MSSDKMSKTVGVALGVCLVCSILVSTAAVELQSIQAENKKVDLLTNILAAGNVKTNGESPQKVYDEKIDAEIIELKSGNVLPEKEYTDVLSVESFDIKTLAGSNEYGEAIPADKDIAGIKRMPKYMVVYEVKGDSGISKYILPIYGKGLWSTMYGFIAIDKDLRTVKGFTFYEQGETPGLGGEVDNPKWKAIWNGKQLFDKNWDLKIQVIKGTVDQSSPNAKYQIDGLSGSTLTTRGVNNLVHFWLSDEGYGPFFKKLRGEA